MAAVLPGDWGGSGKGGTGGSGGSETSAGRFFSPFFGVVVQMDHGLKM